jgi:subtilase family serine protease
MDPTGMSSPLGQLVIAAGLIATIVVLIMILRRRR